MSMIASAVREALEATLQQRSSFLERGLIEMLQTGNTEDWVKDFYEHPIIFSLYREKYKKGAKLPAYIQKGSFSLAILDLAAQASMNGKLVSVANLKSKLLVADQALFAAADRDRASHPNEVQRTTRRGSASPAGMRSA